MEYTIQKLSRMAGVSSRTLRYYDEIDLLKPFRMNSSGYRIYGQAEVNLLQQILFYRELGMELVQIKEILENPGYSRMAALKEHACHLEEKKNRIEALLENVEKSILEEEGKIEMSNTDKFQGFKENLVKENEAKYGKEVVEKYGKKALKEGNERMLNMSEEDYQKMEQLGEKVKKELEEAVQAGEHPDGKRGQKIAELHKEWLSFTWKEYSGEAHAGLAQMYVDDSRFTQYYDENTAGCAVFLKEAIEAYVR